MSVLSKHQDQNKREARASGVVLKRSLALPASELPYNFWRLRRSSYALAAFRSRSATLSLPRIANVSNIPIPAAVPVVATRAA